MDGAAADLTAAPELTRSGRHASGCTKLGITGCYGRARQKVFCWL